MKALVVGLGGAGQRLLRHLRAELGPDADILTARTRGRPALIRPDFTLDPTETVEEHFGVRALPSLAEALAEKPALCVIANPTHLHLGTAIAAADAGCHVLIEKPLGHEAAPVPALARALGDRVGAVGYMMRFHPCLERLRTMISLRELGAPLWAHLRAGSYVPAWHPYEDHRELYAVWRGQGGGVILTESHEIDLALWFFGRPHKVAAAGGKRTLHGGDAEDTAGLLLDYGFPVTLTLCLVQRPPGRAITVAFEHGIAEWDGAQTLRTTDAEGRVDSFVAEGHDRDHLFRDEIRNFLAAIRGEDKPRSDVASGAATLAVCLEALGQLRS